MIKNNSIIMKIVSLLLCLSIIVSIPIPINAESEQNIDTDSSFGLNGVSIDEAHTNDNQITNEEIVLELDAERTENTKTFLLENGNTMVAVYDEPIHYKKSGKWVEYDNTIVASKNNSGKDCFANKSSNIAVQLADDSKENELIKIDAQKKSISWTYENANHTNAKIVTDSKNQPNVESKTIINNQESEAVYENIFRNVDLQCFVTSTGVKENIILKNSDVQNSFSITYNANGLVAKQIDERCVCLCDGDNVDVARIVAPYMMDSNGVISTQLSVKLVSQDGEKIRVTLNADNSFINSKDRAFPIIIDPEIQLNLRNKMTFTACTNNQALSYAPYKLSADSFVLFSLNELPELNDGERITRAQLNMVADNGAEVFTNSNDAPVIIKAHHVGEISGNNITYDNEVIDYDSLTYDDNVMASFDITQTMRDWYEDDDTHNYIIFEADDTIGTRTLRLATPTKTAPVQPTLTYVYKNFAGTEGNLSYHSVEVGHNATASVSDYLGNLVINQPIFAEKGSINLLSVSATYNSLNYNRDFENGSPSGKGWQFSFNQYISEVTGVLAEQGYNYIYRDADGTDHYLKKDEDENKWYDEDGLSLVLIPDSNEIILENAGLEQTYQLPSEGGKIKQEKDEHNNTITYEYEDGNLSRIGYLPIDSQDSSIEDIYIDFNYTQPIAGENRIGSIEFPTDQVVSFSYTSDGKINYICFPDGVLSYFQYDSDGRLVSALKRKYDPTILGKTVSFDYNESGQVENITEYGTDGSEGNYLDIQYNNNNTTTFTDRNGRSAVYTFDNDGSLVSTLNPNGYITNANDGLSFSSGAEAFSKNHIAQSSEFNAIGSNSSSYYYKINASRSGVTSSGGQCAVDSSSTGENGKVQFIGDNSIKIYNPVSSNHAAFYTAVAHQYVGADFNGKSATFSAYVKTENVEQIYSGGSIGAAVKVKCLNASGANIGGGDSIGITGTGDWQRLSVSCSVPANTTKIIVYCMLRYSSGTAWFDCLQLEEGNSASDFNALQNSDFSGAGSWKDINGLGAAVQNGAVMISGSPEVYNDNQTDEPGEESTETSVQYPTEIETAIETEPNGYITTYDNYGNAIKTEQGFVTREVRNTYEVLPTNGTDLVPTGLSDEEEEEDTSFGNSYVYQTTNIGRAGVKFNIVGEAQAHSVPLTNENRTFGIALRINYADETSELHYQNFNACTSRAQTISMAVYPNEDNKVIDTVDFAFVYSYNDNIMTVTNAMLNIALNSYSDSNDPEPEPATGSTEPTEEPTSNRVLIDSEVCTEVVDKSQTYMETGTTYDSTGRYVISETDESGNVVDYTYDARGNLISIDDAIGNVTTYTYNSADQVTEINCGNASNAYTYDSLSGNVLTITHNSFTYSFNYDVFDNLIQSKVGNVAVSSNTYDNNNGNLLRTDYANGDYITYTYDDYDNIIEIAGENGTIAQFVYNKKGLIAKCIDTPNSLTTYYYYDFEGNKTGEYRQSTDGSLSYYTSVNSNGDQVEKASVNGQTKTITSGTDSDGNSFVSYDGVTVDTISDDFGRTEQVTTSHGNSSDSFTTNYEYADGGTAHSTTHRVEKITQKYGTNELVNYEYTYNDNGDITEVYENGTRIAKYTYDNKNQLLTSAEKDTELYKYYYYDNGGNLSGVREYTLVPDSMWYGSFIGSHTYSYGDTNWKDKLTAYDNTSLTYDANGNPLSYRDGMSFTWVNGRILDTVTVGNTTLSMKYDSNGLRTRKGSIKYYYDSSNNLIGMVNGNNTLLFYYDESGNPTSFSHNGTMYFYIKNLQGDICKIVDASGSVIANYTYDAWGKLLSVKDANGNSISNLTDVALLNPLRYRGYVYDDESGLYYLQSRYYDPTIGRFLNADCVFEKFVLNSNAFTFCRNNSVNRIDKKGTASTKLRYPGEIHTQVQLDIQKHHKGIRLEQTFIKGNGKAGRVDVLKVIGGKANIWEVKPITTSFRVAKEQIDSYLHGKWKGHEKTKIKIGNSFKGRTFFYNGYYVKYYYDKHGIVRYYYFDKSDKKESFAQDNAYVYVTGALAIIVIVGSIALIPATGGASLGGLVFA